jgi:hypothetical protein
MNRDRESLSDVPDDLERRLISHLTPSRVPGADETWRAIGGRLPARRHAATRHTQWLYGVAAIIAVLLVLAVLFRFPRAGQPAVGVGQTSTAAPVVASTPTISGTSVRVVGAGVVSLAPLPPFTVWQPGYRVFGENLIAYAYRPDDGTGSQPTSGIVNTRGDGRDLDPQAVAIARARAQEVLDRDDGAMLALIYAVDAGQLSDGSTDPSAASARYFVLVARPAAGRTLPPGEAAWVGSPATFQRSGDRALLHWLAGDTFFTLSVNSTPEQAVVFAGALKPTVLVAPDVPVPAPTPTITVPTVAAAAGPPPTPFPCPTSPGPRRRELICPSNPAAPAGAPTFTEADVRQQFVPQAGYIGPFIATAAPTIAAIEFVAARDYPNFPVRAGGNGPDRSLLCVVTLSGRFIQPSQDPNVPPVPLTTVHLFIDARTGEWFGTGGGAP